MGNERTSIWRHAVTIRHINGHEMPEMQSGTYFFCKGVFCLGYLYLWIVPTSMGLPRLLLPPSLHSAAVTALGHRHATPSGGQRAHSQGNPAFEDDSGMPRKDSAGVFQ